MSQKKLMLLGGIRYLLPVIEAAHKQGYYVITCDYLPNNPAHKYSDEYVNVSIIDREAVLRVAKEKKVDGVISFGVDPGVVPAAYVQNKLGLPAIGSLESVEILQNKDKFRAFLRDNGFNVPMARNYTAKSDALKEKGLWKYPIIVKPTDSAGSKGVTRVNNPDELEPALDYAFEHSFSNHIIIEDFLEKVGCSSDTDCYSDQGKLKFVSFSAQRFDPKADNPYAPVAYSWPSTFTKEQETYLTNEIQRLISLLGMKTSVYNVETRIATDGKPYIMEVTPRGGGNRLAEMLRYATGVDMITAYTRYSVGDEYEDIQQRLYNGHWAEVILHSNQDGIFKALEIAPEYLPNVVERDLWVIPGDEVHAIKGANDAVGTLVLKFDDAESLEKALADQSWWKIVVQ
ncbi:MAG: ATP-grasp domain-containing protein [Bacteroidales bacterium]|nr:ATP-grasp domain-containing protein [Bacteroidales bacterium]